MLRKVYFLVLGLINGYALVILLFRVHEQNIVSFLSFFTILSNIFATIFFLYFGLKLRSKMPRTTDFLYGACTVYMTITGAGYWLLLRNDHTFAGLGLPWLNIMGHGIMPIAVVVGWFIYPHRNRFAYISAAYWLVFPVIYLIYTLFRGELTGWYPYPFLNPQITGSFEAVGGYILFLLILSYLIGLGAVFIGNKRYSFKKK